MTFLMVLIVVTCFLAYSNGANDNFKGVATLFGSGTTDYRMAIGWATITTFMGSICSIFLADQLLKNFSGKGLVPDLVANSPGFLLAVAIGAGAAVFLAALKGFPISTTHSLTGALVGAGLMAVGLNINLSVLGNAFFLPLLVSPLIAVIMAALVYSLFRIVRISLGISKEHCICIGEQEIVVPIPNAGFTLSLHNMMSVEPSLDTQEKCYQRYSGRFFGINCQKLLDAGHYLSAGVVCFARGLNDTPKIIAILLAANALEIQAGLLLVGCSIALGGPLNARRVADTMSNKITHFNHGQGFTANLITGMLVVFASRLGVPVSTTHVSVGSIFGIGLITKQADLQGISGILLSWVLTLPIAAAFSAAIYWLAVHRYLM